MTDPMVGDEVSWFDDWRQERNRGIVAEVRRSKVNPWRVAIVRLHDGAEVEVHPDRLEAVEAADNVR